MAENLVGVNGLDTKFIFSYTLDNPIINHNYMEKLVALKELRLNMEKYANKVKAGQTFIVLKRSKPLFKISPIDDDEEEWETVIDFTKIKKGGVDAKELLKYL